MGISSPELAWLFPRPLLSLLCCPWCLVSGCWDSSLHPESKATGNQAPRPTQPFCLQIHCLPPSARNARELEAGQIAFPIILGFCYNRERDDPLSLQQPRPRALLISCRHRQTPVFRRKSWTELCGHFFPEFFPPASKISNFKPH